MREDTTVRRAEAYYGAALGGALGLCGPRVAAACLAGRRVLVGRDGRGQLVACCGQRRVRAYREGGTSEEWRLEGFGWLVAEDPEAQEWAPLHRALRMVRGGLVAELREREPRRESRN